MKKGLAWSLAALGLLVVVVTGIWFWSNRQSHQWAFADGSTGTFVKATYGTTHRCHVGPFWMALVDMLPRGLQDMLGYKGGQVFTTGESNLVLWIRQSPAPPAGTYYQIEVQFVDENGYATGRDVGTTTLNVPGGDRLYRVQFSAFPRRSRDLTLRILDRDKQYQYIEQARFRLGNPDHRQDPGWEAAPLSLEDQDGDLAFRLVDLRTRVSRRNPGQLPRDSNDERAMAAFEIRRDGVILSNWVPRKIWMTDATGNETTPSSWSNLWETNRQIIFFEGSLWTDEPAWGIRAEFSRDAEYLPDELWTIHHVPVVQGMHATNVVAQTNLFDTVLSLKPAMRQGNRLKLEIVSDVDRENEYRLTLVEVTDQMGQTVSRSGTSWGGTNSGFDLDVDEEEKEIKSLNVTFAWHASRYGEFRARPELGPAE